MPDPQLRTANDVLHYLAGIAKAHALAGRREPARAILDACKMARDFVPKSTPSLLVCPNCGQDDLHATAWVELRTGELLQEEGPLERCWCVVCEDHVWPELDRVAARG